MPVIRSKKILLLLWLFFLCATTLAYAQGTQKELVARGQYIFAVSGGCACHTEPKGVHNAGARPFKIPLGTVYSTNLTSDNETGLGNWTDQQIIDAIIKGLRKDGSRQLPLMPYTLYSGMAQEDVKALVAYIRSLKPVKKATPELKTSTPFMRSVVTELWLKAFGTFYESPAQAPKSGIQRGKYLTNHVAICGDCHTPRNSFGVPNQALYMAGSPKDGPIGEVVPNITPDKETGIGDWKREDIAELLLKGIKPDFDNVQGLMEEVIQGAPHGYKDMTKEDVLAIADYLKSIPAIKNKIK
ncbi:MAG: cytochrome c [Candidatus Binatia bacterium]